MAGLRYSTVVVHGPFHRAWNERTQSAEVLRAVLESGELWGKAPQGSDIPAVKAHWGTLPEGRRGFEFYAATSPDSPYGGVVYWREREDGTVTVEDDYARVKIYVSRVDQEM